LLHILHRFGDTAAYVENRQFVPARVLFNAPSLGMTAVEFRDERDICKN